MANLSYISANAELAALAPLMNSGFIEVYSGPMPANANTALSGSNTLLATLTLSPTAFGAPSMGTITANTIGSAPAINTAIAVFARIYQSDGITVVMDVTVGISGSGAEMIVATTSFIGGATISCSGFTHTITSAP